MYRTLAASLATFILLTLFSARAHAHDLPLLPPNVTSAVVRVDAYEHASLGAVIGDGTLILVPFEAIEVARPGWPHAIVVDANGVRHDAGVAATDRQSGLAILVVEQRLTATPFAMSPSTLTDAIDVFAIGRHPSSGALVDAVWSLYPAGSLAPAGTVPVAPGHDDRIPYPPLNGSPVIDTEGRLVGMMGKSGLFGARMIHLPASALARLDGSSRERRSVIFYGGPNAPFSFKPDGGLWYGLGLSFGARVRDVVDLRLDAEFSALVPGAPTAPRAESECAQKACYAGIRGVVTPSVSFRYILGGGARAQSRRAHAIHRSRARRAGNSPRERRAVVRRDHAQHLGTAAGMPGREEEAGGTRSPFTYARLTVAAPTSAASGRNLTPNGSTWSGRRRSGPSSSSDRRSPEREASSGSTTAGAAAPSPRRERRSSEAEANESGSRPRPGAVAPRRPAALREPPASQTPVVRQRSPCPALHYHRSRPRTRSRRRTPRRRMR